MSGSSGIERPTLERLSVLLGRVAKNLLATIGGLLSITGFIALIASESLRELIKQHPFPIYVLLVLTTLALLATLNYAVAVGAQNRRLRTLAKRAADPRPSTHDLRLFADLMRDVPIDGPILSWLRRANVAELQPTEFPADVLSALENTAARPDMRPVGFDNAEVAGAMGSFLTAIGAFRAAVENWTLLRQHPSWRGTAAAIPVDEDPVLDALVARHQELLRAYDAAIVIAHRHGVDLAPG